MEISNAAIDGDTARVLAWLDADVSEPRDVDDANEAGFTLLFSTTGHEILREEHLVLARELIARGADVNQVDPSNRASIIAMILLGHEVDLVDDLDVYGDRLHDFVLILIRGGLALNRRVPSQSSAPLGVAILALKLYRTRHYLKVFSTLLRAGASLDSAWACGDLRSAKESIRDLASGNEDLLTNEHWVACTRLVDDIRAAGGTWAAYRRHPRKQILRLRSLVLRDRARPRVRTRAADQIVARVLRLPNELCWHVLEFWRATSAATGEVI